MGNSSTVTTKGQIVIPSILRKELGIKKGTRVFFEIRGSDLVVHPATSEFYERTFGILRGGGLVKRLERSRAKERAHEERKIEKR